MITRYLRKYSTRRLLWPEPFERARTALRSARVMISVRFLTICASDPLVCGEPKVATSKVLTVECNAWALSRCRLATIPSRPEALRDPTVGNLAFILQSSLGRSPFCWRFVPACRALSRLLQLLLGPSHGDGALKSQHWCQHTVDDAHKALSMPVGLRMGTAL